MLLQLNKSINNKKTLVNMSNVTEITECKNLQESNDGATVCFIDGSYTTVLETVDDIVELLSKTHNIQTSEKVKE